MTPQTSISNAINVIQDTGCNKRQAFSALVSYASSKINVPTVVTEPMKLYIVEYLDKEFDIESMRDSINDWFTDALEDAGLIPPSDKENVNKIKANILRAISQSKEIPLMPLFIPPQTSRLILMIFERLGRNAIYTGVEPDVLQYHIALFNSKLYHIPAMILNANPDVHVITPGSPNWGWVNVWEKPAWNKMEEVRCKR